MGSKDSELCIVDFLADLNDVHADGFSFSVAVSPYHNRIHVSSMLLEVLDDIFGLVYGLFDQLDREQVLVRHFLRIPVVVLLWDL